MVSIVEPKHGNYILLDSNQPGVIRPPSNGINKLIFQLGDLTAPSGGITKYSIRSMVFGNSTYNIVDDSLYGGLKNNVIAANGNPIIISPGTYTAVNFAAALEALITAAVGFLVTIAYNSITLKLEITAAAPLTLVFGTDSPAYEMGFNQAIYGPDVSFTSNYVVDFGGPAAILINIREIGSYNTVSFNGFICNFIYPLTGATPSISQGNPISLAKLDCWVCNYLQLRQLTVELSFIRNGQIWPLINDANSFYEILLQIV